MSTYVSIEIVVMHVNVLYLVRVGKVKLPTSFHLSKVEADSRLETRKNF